MAVFDDLLKRLFDQTPIYFVVGGGILYMTFLIIKNWDQNKAILLNIKFLTVAIIVAISILSIGIAEWRYKSAIVNPTEKAIGLFIAKFSDSKMDYFASTLFKNLNHELREDTVIFTTFLDERIEFDRSDLDFYLKSTLSQFKVDEGIYIYGYKDYKIDDHFVCYIKLIGNEEFFFKPRTLNNSPFTKSLDREIFLDHPKLIQLSVNRQVDLVEKFVLGIIAYHQGNQILALSYFEYVESKLSAFDSDENPEFKNYVNFYKGNVFLSQNRYNKAKEAYNQVIEDVNKASKNLKYDALFYTTLAQVYDQDLQGASKTLNQIDSLVNNHFQKDEVLAQIKTAIDSLSKSQANALNPRLDSDINEKGVNQLAVNNSEDTIKDEISYNSKSNEEEIINSPKLFRKLKDLGHQEYNDNNFEKALYYYLLASQGNGSEELKFQIANCYYYQGKYQAALEHYRNLEVDSFHSIIHGDINCWVGFCHFYLENVDSALNYFNSCERAYFNFVSDSTMRWMISNAGDQDMALGHCFLAKGNYETAYISYRKSKSNYHNKMDFHRQFEKEHSICTSLGIADSVWVKMQLRLKPSKVPKNKGKKKDKIIPPIKKLNPNSHR